MRKIIVVIALCSVAAPLFGQNQLNLTQYMIHQPAINFAAIAANDALNIAGLHREQWVGFDGAPSSSIFSVNTPIGLTNLSFGSLIRYERIGVHALTRAEVGLAYRAQVASESFLSFGLTGGIINMNSDYSKLTLYDLNDPEFPNNSVSEIQPDFGFSSYLFSENYYFGIAIPSLLRNTGFYSDKELLFMPLDFHYYTTAGYKRSLNENFDLGFSTLVKGVIGSPMQFDLNLQIFYNDQFGLGTSFRSSMDFAFIATFKFWDRFTVSYSYDLGISELARFHNNTHEIVLIFDAPKRNLLPFTSPRF
ncbi:MAG: PorP/SprF family type IX secretion system membrane protein [Crocinitomicaceae bacterium]|nr:PorP/SprF family type IX secretion system membrane protein [Crocinitomicaceae bacterium]